MEKHLKLSNNLREPNWFRSLKKYVRVNQAIQNTTHVLIIHSTIIEDSFAEAFSMRFTRLIITAINRRWLQNAVTEICGYGTSVIGCDAEVGLESWIDSTETLDGRPGASVLLFAFSTKALQQATFNRAGQCLMTCPTTAVFDGLSVEIKRNEPNSIELNSNTNLVDFKPNEIEVGDKLRFFGDGYQKSKLIAERRFWRIPVMDGEFICEDKVGVANGVAGGNFLILAKDQISGLSAAERAVDEIAKLPSVICPFPGGVVRSGSKVGSRYKGLVASTNHLYCPTLRGVEFKAGAGDSEDQNSSDGSSSVQSSQSLLSDDVNCVYEIVIDGTDYASVGNAIMAGVESAAGEGVISITAANYGGKLGKHQYPLHRLLDDKAALRPDQKTINGAG